MPRPKSKERLFRATVRMKHPCRVKGTHVTTIRPLMTRNGRPHQPRPLYEESAIRYNGRPSNQPTGSSVRSLPTFLYAAAMKYPQLPIFAFVAAFLVLVPLPWHWRAQNVATLALIFWLFFTNLIQGVNSIKWAGNLKDDIPVWCDISKFSKPPLLRVRAKF